ncbi:MAG: hypothetical protein IJI14_02640 [Anaerolineaceae bacterium]|nr:hypothetical protein [Anaerolineaceae bacterium]
MSNILSVTKKNLTDPNYMTRACRMMFTIMCMLSGIMFMAGEIVPSVFADDMASAEIGAMFGVFSSLSDLFIKFAYGAMVLIFAVGMVKSGLTAQAAQQFGAAGKVSGELMNVLGGVVVFVFGILSYPLAKQIIHSVTNVDGGIGDKAPSVNDLGSGLVPGK